MPLLMVPEQVWDWHLVHTGVCFSVFACFLSSLVWFFLWLPEEVLTLLFLLHRENRDFSILMKDILCLFLIHFVSWVLPLLPENMTEAWCSRRLYTLAQNFGCLSVPFSTSLLGADKVSGESWQLVMAINDEGCLTLCEWHSLMRLWPHSFLSCLFFGVAGTDRADAIKVVVEFSLQFHSCVVGSCSCKQWSFCTPVFGFAGTERRDAFKVLLSSFLCNSVAVL